MTDGLRKEPITLTRIGLPSWTFTYGYDPNGMEGWYYQGRKYLYRLFFITNQWAPDIWIGRYYEDGEEWSTYGTIEREIRAMSLGFGRGRFVFDYVDLG